MGVVGSVGQVNPQGSDTRRVVSRRPVLYADVLGSGPTDLPDTGMGTVRTCSLRGSYLQVLTLRRTAQKLTHSPTNKFLVTRPTVDTHLSSEQGGVGRRRGGDCCQGPVSSKEGPQDILIWGTLPVTHTTSKDSREVR